MACLPFFVADGDEDFEPVPASLSQVSCNRLPVTLCNCTIVLIAFLIDLYSSH